MNTEELEKQQALLLGLQEDLNKVFVRIHRRVGDLESWINMIEAYCVGGRKNQMTRTEALDQILEVVKESRKRK